MDGNNVYSSVVVSPSCSVCLKTHIYSLEPAGEERAFLVSGHGETSEHDNDYNGKDDDDDDGDDISFKCTRLFSCAFKHIINVNLKEDFGNAKLSLL